MEEKPAQIFPAIIAGLLLLILVVIISGVFFTPPLSPLPHITPVPSLIRSPPVVVSHTFPYENSRVTITVPVNLSVYAGARAVERKAVNIHNATEIQEEIYRVMIFDTVQEPLFDSLLFRFRTIRAEQNLSDDEYLELLMTYVQSLRYTVSDGPARYPAETVMEGGGDCDDKSLLLAGLLAREGYPVALFLFRPEEHMAVGAGSDVLSYKSTGYAYIETTGYSYAGVPPEFLRGNITLASDPMVIPVSTGTKRYPAGNGTLAIPGKPG